MKICCENGKENRRQRYGIELIGKTRSFSKDFATHYRIRECPLPLIGYLTDKMEI